MSEIYLPISDIYIELKKRRLIKYDEQYDFIGFDSETYEGKCKLLCSSLGTYLLDANFYDYLEFLIQDKENKAHRIFWNMDFDLSSIFKLYKGKVEKIKRLLEGYTETFKGYELTYLRPKFFSIKKAKKTIVFTDMYFMFKKSLNSASKEFLNNQKFDDIDGNLLNTDLNYWKERLNDIIKYCIQDCKLTADLGKFLVDNVRSINLPIPKYLTSHASFSKEYFMKTSKIASIKWIPQNILDIATQCYFGGRFEVLERGCFKRLYAYDINSAYPDTISRLPSLKYGKWKRIIKPSKKEIIGYYKVHLVIPEQYLSPFIIKHKGICIFPSGVFETWITWYEYDLLKPFIMEFYYGYEYYPSKREYYPFREGIYNLYEQKAKMKGVNDVLYWIYKIFMNALYGCFIERHKDIETGMVFAGKMFNSVYASTITARTRWKLLKDVKRRHWKDLVGFHTDSVMSKRKLRELKCNEKLGNWSLEKKGKAILLMSGVYQIGKESKNRGFSTKKTTSLKDNEYGNKLDWFKLLNKNLYKDSIKFEKVKVIKSAESLKRWNNLEKVNTFTEYEKSLNINSDKKRVWNRDFENCKDVLDSTIRSKTVKMKFMRDDNLG